MNKTPPSVPARLASYAFVVVAFLAVAAEWTDRSEFRTLAAIVIGPAVLLLTPLVPWKRRLFVVAAFLLAAIAPLALADAGSVLYRALYTAAFIGGFFVSLTMLADASATAAALRASGRYLAEQPPGRRYLALTIGGHLFGLCLSYGSIALLGGLAEAVAKREPNPEIRHHRLRRMLLAVQRGFLATLAWSPLGFSMALSTTLIPGATWADAVAPCLLSAAIYASVGWALDSIFKPRLSRPSPTRAPSERSWTDLWPLFVLLIVLASMIVLMSVLTGQRVISIVMLTIPAISLGWIALQNRRNRPLAAAATRAVSYVRDVMPRYQNELLLLPAAGFIGVVGSSLAKPLVAASGIDLAAAPPALILVALLWIFPLAGQIGMNPILAVSLFAPLLPSPEAMGVAPTAVIMAITGGWVLGAASSPFTATTLLVGGLGGVSAAHVGLRWNGLFMLIGGALVSAWVVIYAGL